MHKKLELLPEMVVIPTFVFDTVLYSGIIRRSVMDGGRIGQFYRSTTAYRSDNNTTKYEPYFSAY